MAKLDDAPASGQAADARDDISRGRLSLLINGRQVTDS